MMKKPNCHKIISPTTISILACDCISEGSVNANCDDNGRCMCNQHVEGDKCDVCKTGYGDFPDCDQCIDGYHGYPNCIGKCVAKSLLFFQ